ncbi:MAG: FkbM family methyltransferase [Elusimicrobia bacterium]|nr:FkbM family methyltransferase [Elusimicrobiota bacterium]
MGLKREVAGLAARWVSGALDALGSLRPLRRFMLRTGGKLRFTESEVKVNGQALRLHTPNELSLFRAETYFTKEPETLEWIDSFEGEGVLFDIGANVGTYSLYAAKKGLEVLAFEPEAQNFAGLNRNIAVNGLDDKITALNVALSDRTAVDRLHLSALSFAAANHSLGASVDFNGNPRSAGFRQGILSYSLDGFLEAFPVPFPNYIKLDVDGLESKIVAGAQKTLADPRLRSLLIEINEALPKDLAIVETLRGLGFLAEKKPRAPMPDSQIYEKLFNYVFRRNR